MVSHWRPVLKDGYVPSSGQLNMDGIASAFCRIVLLQSLPDPPDLHAHDRVKFRIERRTTTEYLSS